MEKQSPLSQQGVSCGKRTCFADKHISPKKMKLLRTRDNTSSRELFQLVHCKMKCNRGREKELPIRTDSVRMELQIHDAQCGK